LISLDFGIPQLHAPGMKILLTIVVVQSLNLAIFAWFNRAAWIRILALRQQLAVYKRKSKPADGRLVAHPVLNGLHHDYRLAA
jgi:hypothetical protein